GSVAAHEFRRTNGTMAAPTHVSSGNQLYIGAFIGYGTTGYNASHSASFQAIAAEDFTDTAQGTVLDFGTTPSGTVTETNRLRLDGLGAILSKDLALPAGGTAGFGYRLSSTANFGVFVGSGAPTLSAAKGSIYQRSDGDNYSRAYVNVDGGTTYHPLAT